jgi:FlaA1/EpsC-like NDP-sugar epimerase
MKAMLITGATGSVGGELVARYYPHYRIYAQGRDAQQLLKLKMRYPGIHLVLGDLRCHGLHEALECCQVVIHAAAQKYVDLAERHCAYTIDTNVVCTHELGDLAARRGVERFILVSTDKSSGPTNVYGVTKYLAERLVLELSDTYTETCYVICRFGNIFGSNGSVVQLWLDAVRMQDGAIQVTDPDMTRFMFSLGDAVETVNFALAQGRSGDIIIPKMRGVCLRDLVNLFENARVQIVGKRPGEKMHETLFVKGEISTGHETEAYYILNRSDPHVLQMDTLDSSQVERVDPRLLRLWFEKIRQRFAPELAGPRRSPARSNPRSVGVDVATPA